MPPRSARNKNPGNLRPRALPAKWAGQVALDTAAGGPFAVFGAEADGWCALATCLLAYQAKGIRTIAAAINRWAPASDNNDPGSYAAAVAKTVGVTPTDPVDFSRPEVMRALATGIARVEGGGWPWDEKQKAAGLAAALGGKSAPAPVVAAPVKPPAPVPAHVLTADELNAAELAKHRTA